MYKLVAERFSLLKGFTRVFVSLEDTMCRIWIKVTNRSKYREYSFSRSKLADIIAECMYILDQGSLSRDNLYMGENLSVPNWAVEKLCLSLARILLSDFESLSKKQSEEIAELENTLEKNKTRTEKLEVDLETAKSKFKDLTSKLNCIIHTDEPELESVMEPWMRNLYDFFLDYSEVVGMEICREEKLIRLSTIADEWNRKWPTSIGTEDGTYGFHVAIRNREDFIECGERSLRPLMMEKLPIVRVNFNRYNPNIVITCTEGNIDKLKCKIKDCVVVNGYYYKVQLIHVDN